MFFVFFKLFFSDPRAAQGLSRVMADHSDKDEALSTFIAVTGSSYEVAREALETNNWDVERAINTHLEVSALNTPAPALAAAATTASAPVNTHMNQNSARQQSSVAAGLHGGHVIDLGDDLLDEISLQRRRSGGGGGGGVQQNNISIEQVESPPAPQMPLQSRTSVNEVIDVDVEEVNERTNDRNETNTNNAAIVVDADRNYIEEQMLRQALEESLQTVNQQQSEVITDEEIEDVPEKPQEGQMLSETNIGEEQTGPSSSMVHDHMAARGRSISMTGGERGKRQHTSMSDSPDVSHNLQRSNSLSSNDAAAAVVGDRTVDVQEDVVLPEGVNAEEAKMLEAAMFGIPYQGPMPQTSTFRDTISSSSMTPEMRAQRQIRMEQDRAFHASLKADQEKEAAKHRQEMEKKRKLQEESDRKQKLQQTKEKLLLELSNEPSEPAEEIVNVMIRLPDGTRLSRKFLKSSPVRLLFRFVDYRILTEKEASNMKPGAYKIFTQFPRKAIVETDANTLEDVGLVNKQEALFVEMVF